MVQATRRKMWSATLVLVTGTVLFHTITIFNRGNQVEFLPSSPDQQQPTESVFHRPLPPPTPAAHRPPPAETLSNDDNSPVLSQTPSNSVDDLSTAAKNKAHSAANPLLTTIDPKEVPRPSTLLDPSIKYLAFLSYAGLTNQVG